MKEIRNIFGDYLFPGGGRGGICFIASRDVSLSRGEAAKMGIDRVINGVYYGREGAGEVLRFTYDMMVMEGVGPVFLVEVGKVRGMGVRKTSTLVFRDNESMSMFRLREYLKGEYDVDAVLDWLN